MPYTKKREFDEAVIRKINLYIDEHDLSLNKLAKATDMTYHQLYQILNNNQIIKLREYVKICEAFDEPFERFL